MLYRRFMKLKSSENHGVLRSRFIQIYQMVELTLQNSASSLIHSHVVCLELSVCRLFVVDEISQACHGVNEVRFFTLMVEVLHKSCPSVSLSCPMPRNICAQLIVSYSWRSKVPSSAFRSVVSEKKSKMWKVNDGQTTDGRWTCDHKSALEPSWGALKKILIS